MQCTQCGAVVRPGMTECLRCGAPVAQSSGSGVEANRAADRYVPGGGAAPQQPTTTLQPDQLPQQRALGSLQRRLQRSQASVPGADDPDDDWNDVPPPHPGQSRAAGGRRPSAGSGNGYGARGRRSQPMADAAPQRRSQTSGGRSRADNNRRSGYDDSREEPAYSPYPGYRPDYDESREQPAWAESREGPAQRRSSEQNRRRPMDESAEMSAEGPAYGPPQRSTPRRRSRPISRPIDNRFGASSDYTNPLDDPRSPLRSSQSRRPSQGAGSRGGRSSGGYGAGGPGYTEAEMRAQGYRDDDERYGDYGQSEYGTGYSEELPAAHRRGDGYDPYDRDEDYASRERWAAPMGDQGYADTPYAQNGYGSGFEDSAELWQPVGVPARVGGSGSQGRARGGGARPAAKRKRKGGVARGIFGLLVTLALVAVLGVEFGPKVYHKLLAGGSAGPTQSAVTCATSATPSAQAKPPAGDSAFATTAYTLNYPTSWQTNMQSGASASQCDVVFLFSQPNGAAKFNVEEAGAFTPLSDQQIIQAEAQSAQQQGSTFVEITSAATTQQVGGEVWQRREYQVTSKTGVKLHLALLATHHKNAGFAIVMLSSDAGFSSDDTTTFEPILHSFQFV